MNEKERLYIKYNGANRGKQSRKTEFMLARAKFDKSLRKAERQYNKQFLCNLETLNTSNPKDFWNKIKQLGPRKQSIPMEVEIDCKRYTDKNIVMENWASEFENLLNQNGENTGLNEHYSEFVNELSQRESNLSENNEFLNHAFTLDEVRYHINKCKNNKFPGLDNIPYEVLKCEDLELLLYKLFNFCFNNNVIPSDWGKAIITPIPKCSSKTHIYLFPTEELVYFPVLARYIPVF